MFIYLSMKSTISDLFLNNLRSAELSLHQMSRTCLTQVYKFEESFKSILSIFFIFDWSFFSRRHLNTENMFHAKICSLTVILMHSLILDIAENIFKKIQCPNLLHWKNVVLFPSPSNRKRSTPLFYYLITAINLHLYEPELNDVTVYFDQSGMRFYLMPHLYTFFNLNAI